MKDRETVIEAAERLYPESIFTSEESLVRRLAFISGAKWKQEELTKIIKNLNN